MATPSIAGKGEKRTKALLYGGGSGRGFRLDTVSGLASGGRLSKPPYVGAK